MQTFSIQNKAKRKEFAGIMLLAILVVLPFCALGFIILIAALLYGAVTSFENPFWVQLISNIFCLVFCSVGAIKLVMDVAFSDVNQAKRRYFEED
jgi:protein-S-isoprenylcysteine O-methyltransferase Ste14